MRFGLMLPSLFGVTIVSFLLIHLVPGDPVDLILGEQAAIEDRENLRKELGLDKPLLNQFITYIVGLVRLDPGISLVTRKPISTEIALYFPATLELAFAAILLGAFWGLPLGVWTAAKPSHLLRMITEPVILISMSLSAVFLGPALVYIFALRLDVLPVSERGEAQHLILPALSLALPLGAVIFRMTQTSLRQVLHEDYIRTARAKGLGDPTVFFKHAVANALIPVITVLSLQLGAMLTGTVITETIFDWPGIGSLLFNAIQRRDYPVVQTCILMFAVIYILVNLMADLLYAAVNPRIRLSNK